MLPPYTKTFIQSSIFFPVIFADGTFQTAIGKGVLLIIAPLTGNRSAIPLCWAWALSENKMACSKLYNMIAPFEDYIESIFEDGGVALNRSSEEILSDVFLQLCAWHAKRHVKAHDRKYFWRFVKASTFIDMINAENKIKNDTDLKDLYDFMKDKFHMLSKFRSFGPRFDFLTTAPLEGLNGLLSSSKSKEPFEVFKLLYMHGLKVITRTMEFTGFLMPKADQHITRALFIANTLPLPQRLCNMVSFKIHTKTKTRNYDVNLDTYTCTCRYRSDCGLPCPHLLRAVQLFDDNNWGKLVHKCYFLSEFRKAFHEPIYIPPFADLSEEGHYRPPVLFSLKGRSKRRKSKEELGVEKTKKKQSRKTKLKCQIKKKNGN